MTFQTLSKMSISKLMDPEIKNANPEKLADQPLPGARLT